MKTFPHVSPADASAELDGPVTVSSKDLPSLLSAPPAEFDGPGDRWSPETLLVAAAADCFVLTFRAFARANELEWKHLDCHVEGTLDRVERRPQFTKLVVRARLAISDETLSQKARELLERSERACLITNSLKGETEFIGEVDVVA